LHSFSNSKDFHVLRCTTKGLREEMDALLECLEVACLVRRETVLHAMHRRRFAAVQLKNPIGDSRGLSDVLEVGDWAERLGDHCSIRDVFALAAVSSSSRQMAEDAIRKSRMHLYVLGGSSDQHSHLSSVERLGTEATAWETLPPMATARTRFSALAVVMAGGLYISRRMQLTAIVDRLDLNMGTWEELPAMHQMRHSCAFAVMGGRLYACGGEDFKGRTLRSVERLGPDSLNDIAAWETLPSMTEARCSPAFAVLRGHLYVCGGEGHGSTLSSAERLGPNADNWWALPSMEEARFSPACAVMGSRLYVCGGEGPNGNMLSTFERLDPDTAIWETLPPMSESRLRPSFAVMGARLYVCGGMNDEGLPLSFVERFDPDVGAWESLPLMSEARHSCACAVMGRRLYICGGEGPSGRILNSVERFDPDAGTWEPLPSMSEVRSLHLAVVAA